MRTKFVKNCLLLNLTRFWNWKLQSVNFIYHWLLIISRTQSYVFFYAINNKTLNISLSVVLRFQSVEVILVYGFFSSSYCSKARTTTLNKYQTRWWLLDFKKLKTIWAMIKVRKLCHYTKTETSKIEYMAIREIILRQISFMYTRYFYCFIFVRFIQLHH